MTAEAAARGGPPPRIYVDGDACPVKPEVYRVARRHGLPVFVVAKSWMRVPEDPAIEFVQVPDGADAADDWIAERIGPGDVAVTADIPLAARCLERGAFALGAAGRPFTAENIGQALATRALLAGLRGSGERTGGPPPLSKRDRSLFLQRLDEMVRAALRAARKPGEG